MSKTNFDELKKSLEVTNKHLEGLGLCPMDVVNPKDLVGAKVNARYFLPEKMQQLVNNIKKDKRLESTPLVYVDKELKKGKYRIISGHHRVDAAKAAGIDQIVVMIADPEDTDDVISKQLGHNALTGEDDEVLLKVLYESIKDIEKRIATGLDGLVDSISYTSLNFKLGQTKTFTMLFFDEQLKKYDEVMDEVSTKLSGTNALRVTSIKAHEKFIEAIIRLKKVENIKNNSAAFMRLVEIGHSEIMKMDKKD